MCALRTSSGVTPLVWSCGTGSVSRPATGVCALAERLIFPALTTAAKEAVESRKLRRFIFVSLGRSAVDQKIDPNGWRPVSSVRLSQYENELQKPGLDRVGSTPRPE